LSKKFQGKEQKKSPKQQLRRFFKQQPKGSYLMKVNNNENQKNVKQCYKVRANVIIQGVCVRFYGEFEELKAIMLAFGIIKGEVRNG